MIKTAVIGLGAMGQHHARVYSEIADAELVAVSDVRKASAKKIADRYRCNWFLDYMQMLKKEEVDAVSIVVPTSLHEKVAVDVASFGKHILVEKPIASNLQSAYRILKAAEENDVKLMVGHIERFNPVIQKTRDLIGSGKVGNIYTLSCKRIGPHYSRIRDIGVIIDLAIHDLDVIYYLLDERPREIFCFDIRNVPEVKSKSEVCAQILLKFKSKKICSVEVNCISAKKIRDLLIVGSRALLSVNYIAQELVMKEKMHAFQIETYEDLVRSLTTGEEKSITLEREEPLKVELEHFVRSVKNDKQPIVSGQDGIFALKMGLAAVESARSGRLVSI